MKLSEIPIKADWIGCHVQVVKSSSVMTGNNVFQGVVVDFKKRVLVAFPQALHSRPQWHEPEKLSVLKLADGSAP